MDWPYIYTPLDGLVTMGVTTSIASMASYATGGINPGSAQTWPVANLAIYVPFRLSSPMLVNRLYYRNGVTVTYDIDIGIYDAYGARLISTGTIDQGAASTTIDIDVTDIMIGPGLFYMAFVAENAAATFWMASWGGLAQWFRCAGFAQEALGSTLLPAIATFASPASVSRFPHMGFTARSMF
jgi:hypothetical protein